MLHNPEQLMMEETGVHLNEYYKYVKEAWLEPSHGHHATSFHSRGLPIVPAYAPMTQ